MKIKKKPEERKIYKYWMEIYVCIVIALINMYLCFFVSIIVVVVALLVVLNLRICITVAVDI